MRDFAVLSIVVGSLFVLASLLMSTGLMPDPTLPIPLAIGGSGFFIGGAILFPRPRDQQPS